MEIKIQCACGTKFKFDVEPVNGRSPGAVRCPSCGQDRTEATNELIEQKLGAGGGGSASAAPIAVATAVPAARISVGVPNTGGPKVAIPAIRVPAASAVPGAVAPAAPMVVPSPAPAPVAQAAPAAHAVPVAPAATVSVGPKMASMPVPTGGGKSLSVAAAHAPAPAAQPAEQAAPAAAPILLGNPASGKVARPKASAGPTNLTMGIVGAVIGTLIGAGIWFYVGANFYPIRILAWVPGLLGGLGAKIMGGHGSEKLAQASAVVAGVITVAVQFAVISSYNENTLSSLSTSAYEANMDVAKKAANAITDEQVRAVMTEDTESKFEFEEPEKIAAEEVAKYRTGRMAELQKLAKGDPSRTKFIAKQREKLSQDEDVLYSKSWFWMLVWIASSVSSAYKIALGKDKSP